MTKLILAIVLALIGFSAYAKSSSGEPSNTIIRCEGINPSGRAHAGIDFEFDPVDRLQNVTTWE